MAVNCDTPKEILLKSASANRWEISYHKVENRPEGMAVTVAHNAMLIESGAVVPGSVVNLEPSVYTSDRLNLIVADAGERTVAGVLVMSQLPDTATIADLKAFLATPAGLQAAGLSEYAGVRDSLYAALEADGKNPLV